MGNLQMHPGALTPHPESQRGGRIEPCPTRHLAGSYLVFSGYALRQLGDASALMALLVAGVVLLALVGTPSCRRGIGQTLGVTVAQVLDEAAEMTHGSIRFAEWIDHATSGDRLGRIMRDTMDAHPSVYGLVRSTLVAKIDELGGADQAIGLFMLAADMATTAAIAADDRVDAGDRQELRRLWNDLRSQ